MISLIFNCFFIFSIVFLLFGVCKFGINSLAKPAAYTTILMLFVYYFPVIFFPYFDSERYKQAVIYGHIGLVFGFLLIAMLKATKVPLSLDVGSAESKRTKLPSPNWFVGYWFLGLLGYALLYVVRGVPAFANDVAIAREAFISGVGFVTWPSLLFINAGIWGLILHKRYKASLVIAVLGIMFVFLSGWRGSALLIGISSFFIIAANHKISARLMLMAALLVLLLIATGVLRAQMSGQELYGVSFLGATGVGDIVLSMTTYLVGRISEHTLNFSLALQVFDGNHMGGDGVLMDLSFILPGSNMTLANYFKYRFGGWEGGGGMPITLFGQPYVDFGVLGIFLLSMFFSFIYGFAVFASELKGKSDPRYLVFSGVSAVAWFYAFFGSFVQYFGVYIVVYGGGFVFLCFLPSLLKKRILLSSKSRCL